MHLELNWKSKMTYVRVKTEILCCMISLSLPLSHLNSLCLVQKMQSCYVISVYTVGEFWCQLFSVERTQM